MRTFEFKEGKSAKFWNIELNGNVFTVTYGRLGTAGQTQTKTFADAAKAQAAHDKLIAEKTGKGYVETSAKKAAASSPLQQSLEKAILDNPDDVAAHSAYADYLTEQGDPHGEFIQVQLALEDPKRPAKDRKELESREKELLKKHGEEWLGELAGPLLKNDRTGLGKFDAEHLNLEFRFARGWLDSLTISKLSVQLARILARSSETRLLRRLVIDQEAYQEALEDPNDRDGLNESDGWFEPGRDTPEDEESPAYFPLRSWQHVGNVRVLQIGEQVADNDHYPTCRTRCEIAVDLIKKMPRIEELYLLAHGVDTKSLFKLPTLTNLRILQVYHLHEYPLALLGKNPALANLRELRLHPHGMDGDEAYIRLDGLGAITRSSILKNLTHLSIHCSDVGDAGCEEIVKSGILKRLKVLDLRHGAVTDKGAETLAACPDLKNLELLDLDRNGLTEQGQRLLTETGIKVKAKDQMTAGEIADQMYLYEADPE